MKNFLFAILAAMLGINSYGQITTAFKFKTQSFELRDTLCPDNQTYKLFSTASDSKETRPGMPELPVSYNQFIMPDSLQVIALMELASHISAAGSYARNLLISQSAMVYNEPYIFPDENLKSGKVIRKKQIIGKSDVVLKVYPNPAVDYIIAEYQLDECINKPLLNIIDVLGRNLQSFTLSCNKGYEVIPLINLPPGIYTITLCTNGTKIKEVKVIISQ